MAIPRIAITPGEPAGIGPDVVLQAALRHWPAQLIAVADPALLARRTEQLGLSVTLETFNADAPPQAHQRGKLLVEPVPLAAVETPGTLNTANAGYVLDSLRRAVALCRAGTCHAMVTGPVQKSVINDAGIAFTGHTEFLQEETASPEVVMMLATSKLRVALATTHLALADVPAAITREGLRRTLQVLHRDLQQRFGLAQPRIAVLGLNPHAGEGGHMGREEIETIIPVLDELRSQGLTLDGPLPADTAFNAKVLDESDAVFAMYHDQGLPVLKYSGFGEAINITLGLPIIRTSVDHGTALDVAGSGEAKGTSLALAIDVAIDLVGKSAAAH